MPPGIGRGTDPGGAKSGPPEAVDVSAGKFLPSRGAYVS